MCALYIIYLKQGSIIMNQETMNYVMQKMSPFLDNGQTFWLEKVLEEVIYNKKTMHLMKKIMMCC